MSKYPEDTVFRDPDYVSPEGLPWWKMRELTEFAAPLGTLYSVWKMSDMNKQWKYALMGGNQIIAAEDDEEAMRATINNMIFRAMERAKNGLQH